MPAGTSIKERNFRSITSTLVHSYFQINFPLVKTKPMQKQRAVTHSTLYKERWLPKPRKSWHCVDTGSHTRDTTSSSCPKREPLLTNPLSNNSGSWISYTHIHTVARNTTTAPKKTILYTHTHIQWLSLCAVLSLWYAAHSLHTLYPRNNTRRLIRQQFI